MWVRSSFFVYEFDRWKIFLCRIVLPMVISGMMQTLNKFEQHLGLHGQSVLGLTRTVVDQHPAGELVSATMLFNDYHGTHHRYAKIPYYRLPHATPYTLSERQRTMPRLSERRERHDRHAPLPRRSQSRSAMAHKSRPGQPRHSARLHRRIRRLIGAGPSFQAGPSQRVR